MRAIACISTGVFLLMFAGCSDDPGTPQNDGGTSDAPALTDSDGDSISDADEGARTNVDTDGDGTPDHRDLDSDDDGIPDSVEAGDANIATLPIDSDMDLTPDFRDLDADGNGISDADEGTEDNDRDGAPDYRDVDDDDDGAPDALELMGVIDPPADTDDDGVPNFRDPDSDDDRIIDGDEFGRDTDGDGLFDWEDLDSDDDGIPDEEEAGDDDLRSAPFDTDGDLAPDFRDADSDNDGLSDAAELDGGTSPVLADTDGDEISDLIEVAAGTDPLDGSVSPRTRGDFVFVVPYMEDPAPHRDTLEFRTNIQFADIYFLFDASGSMSGEIGALRTAVATLVTDLTCTDSRVACTSDVDCVGAQICSGLTGTCIEDPGSTSCLLSPWTGAGHYEANLRNLLSIQPDPAATSTALSFATFGSVESLHRALWGVADPVGAPAIEQMCATPMVGRIGCPAFRDEAVRVLVAFTDEDSDGTETALQSGTALRDADITLVGVWTGTAGAVGRQSLVDAARESGSVDRDGMPLVYDGQDTAVVPAVSAAINEIVQGVPLRVTIESSDEPEDSGDALQFIDYLEVNTSGGRCVRVGAVEDTDGDGRPDAFPGIRPGTPVCWDVVAARNETVMPELEPLVFRARLTVRGDGSPLDSRIVYFLIPPRIEEPGGPD